ncbi:MAG: folate family ECF transporter S component [Cellulosilyticaceae bacterium]
MKNKFSTKHLVLLALLIALNIILVRFAQINLGPTLRVTFGFVPIVIMALLFGPVYAGIGAGIADFIGAIVFPVGGAYFPGFTLSAILTGIIYGIVLHGKRCNMWRIVTANCLVIVLVQLLLNSLWLTLLYDKAFMALIGAKVIKSLAMLPIESAIILLTYKYIYPSVNKVKLY